MTTGKRVFDLALSVPALVILAPVLTVVAVAVFLRMGRPVLFRDERLGLHGKPFVVYKFRTMTNARDSDGNLLPDLARLTQFGRFLRRTSLDEVPQLINVVQGTMSLVGPRPLLLRYEPYFTGEERLRFTVRPGITGLALILGRNDLPWDERLAADVRYAKDWSILLDMRILLLTIWRVLMREGLRVDPGATMLDLDMERSLAMEREPTGEPHGETGIDQNPSS